ncbi:MAG: DNA polymerase III subunit gamma/tau [Vicinamibacterales bacterium]
MSYQVLARKWRPQRFDDVLGQQAVTRTLRNALKSRRIAHAFVFAGPRGCGKTTTARLLARALNCVNGPTTDPCGACDSCVEIAEGRDMDVLEIDAATHTGVDNVREVIIEGLSIAPVRNRYKVFIIDEVHMLSSSSFNALLKSIEEPPPHVVFMMATTELHKIPDTVLSRSQVYEFRTISSKTVAERLRHIATEEQIEIPDEALVLLARAGEGSMRDSLSAFDQVRAFAGDTVSVEDVVSVLGLVGRDLVFDMLESVVAEDAAAAFSLVETAIERGYDLRLLCRELARATRDLLLLSVDPSRASDPDVAAEGERERLMGLVDRSSREDLLRGFDLLTRAEQEIRQSEQPRFNMEMALLRLMHLRKLVPLAELLSGGAALAARPAPRLAGDAGPSGGSQPTRVPASAPAARPAGRMGGATPASTRPGGARLEAPRPSMAPPRGGGPRAGAAVADDVDADAALPAAPVADTRALKDALLAEIKRAKVFFYNTVVAQAYSVDVAAGAVTFSFLPNQKVPRQQCESAKAWLEELASGVAGGRVAVRVALAEGEAPAAPAPGPVATGPATSAPASSPDEAALRDEALANPTVQALFEIFPVEKTKIEEM